MRTTLIAALLLLTATPALAEADWVNLGDTKFGTETRYIDRSSIRITGPIRRYWVRTDFVNNPNGWEQSVALWEDNCASGQTRLLDATIYKVDGTNESENKNGTNGPSPWMYVIPGSMMAASNDYVCRKRPHRRIR